MKRPKVDSSDALTDENRIASTSRRRRSLVLLCLSGLVALCAIAVFPLGLVEFDSQVISPYDIVSQDIVVEFEKYDRNGDGKLDLSEFEPLAHILKTKSSYQEYVEEIDPADQFITLKAFIDPFEVSRTKTLLPFISDDEPFKFLKDWREPHIQHLNFGCKHFKPLLPQNVDELRAGQVWDLIPRFKGINAKDQLSSNRYNPPEARQNERILFRILQMLHPRPFLLTRFGPHGTSLALRAVNDELLDIVFRVHAEYQLNQPPYFPFWFTPAQLNGRLIISKDASSIKYFQLYLPTEKALNIDMEWIENNEQQMEVDIGFMSRLEVKSTAPSINVTQSINHPNGKEEEVNLSEVPIPEISDASYQNAIKSLSWKEEISIEEAFSLLEKSFYPFKQVKYHNFSEAFKLAQELDRPVHYILLWGSLDDQSC